MRGANFLGMRRIAIGIVLALLAASPSATADEVCSRRESLKVLHSFVQAYNEGDSATLDRLVAPQEDFWWYQVLHAERPWPLSVIRSTLPEYFEERNGYGDRLRLTKLQVEKRRGGDGLWAIYFELGRRSEDPRPFAEGKFHGKTQIRCSIEAWSMAPD